MKNGKKNLQAFFAFIVAGLAALKQTIDQYTSPQSSNIGNNGNGDINGQNGGQYNIQYTNN